MKLKKAIIALILLGCICAIPNYRQIAATAEKISVPMTMVIDAGHGGMDGGACGADGTKEQKINLEIAQALAKEAERYGVKTVMTRTSEEGLYEEEHSGGSWSKVGDMRRRKQIIEEVDPQLVISFHLNSFIADTSVHGAQVFYPGEGSEELTEENKEIAEKIQKSLKEKLGAGADRIVLPKQGIYLFKNNSRNMILVECGFLSNPEDLGNLKIHKYQEKIAEAVMEAAAEHYNLKPVSDKRTKVIDSRTNAQG